MRLVANRAPALGDILPIVLAIILVSAVALALEPTQGQPVYVVSAQPSAIPTGWYIQLGDSHDPSYLLTCSGSRVIAAPISSVASWTYGAPVGGRNPQTLLSILQTGHVDLGLRLSCPTAPPTP